MVTEAGAGGGEGGHGAAVEGGHHQTQTSQYSQWTGCSRYQFVKMIFKPGEETQYQVREKEEKM